MKAIIRNFSTPTEFLLVTAVCFGFSIVASLIWIINHLSYVPSAQAGGLLHPDSSDVVQLTNDGIVVTVILELIMLGIALWIGRIRGWSLATFGFRISWKWTGLGILLFLSNRAVLYCIHALSWQVTATPHAIPEFLRVSHLTIPFVILISTVNPIYEEAFESGYFFRVLERYGMWITIFISALFRGFLHVTMGLNGFYTMFAMGLLYGFVYWRWRQLWPLIVAHSLQMYVALLPAAVAQ